ncbi:MAG: ABC transporter permease [Bdellovibrionales bacterium]|nr:ABC transporter permease [Bdellovibrionales bacterium]
MTNKLRSGLIIVGLITLVGVFAPWLSPYNPQKMSLKDRLEGPSWSHPLGLDENGSDILSRLLFGARVSLSVAWSVVLISAGVGLIVGSYAAFRGGWPEMVLMRVVDMVYAFPSFLLALALVAMLGPALRNLIIALCLTSWTGFARLVRGEVLHLKEREHVLNAKALGAGGLRQIVLHIWPNLAGLLLVQMTFALAGTVIAESGLSFLGLGVSPSTPTWGSLLNSGRRVLAEAPHVSFAAGSAIILLVLGFNLLGDGLRDHLDPRRVRNSN